MADGLGSAWRDLGRLGSALLGSAWLVAEVWLDEDDDDMMMMTMTNLKSINRIASQSTEPQINQYHNQ